MKHWLACLLLAALPALAAAPQAAPAPAANDNATTYQHLVDAAHAVVGIKVKALANARSSRNTSLRTSTVKPRTSRVTSRVGSAALGVGAAGDAVETSTALAPP